MTRRCSIQYPIDQYQSLPCVPSPQLVKHIRRFLWNRVKNYPGCCCQSRFFCSSSRTLEKCQTGCCGKCHETDDDSDMNYDTLTCFDSDDDWKIKFGDTESDEDNSCSNDEVSSCCDEEDDDNDSSSEEADD